MEAFGFLKREGFLSIFEYHSDADFAVSDVDADCEVNHSALSCVMEQPLYQVGAVLSGGLARTSNYENQSGKRLMKSRQSSARASFDNGAAFMAFRKVIAASTARAINRDRLLSCSSVAFAITSSAAFCAAMPR